ncbi:MAG: fluoride efflux transporter FluC [Candidatus Nanopelagicales bacterium]
MNLPVWLLVALGGALGSVARWFSEALLNQLTFNWIYSEYGFNYSILIINILGSLAIGLIAGFGRHQVKVWSFWATGVLGGFTTFSTLMLISYWHLIDRYLGLFILNIFATFFLAFVAVTIGIKISQTKSEA